MSWEEVRLGDMCNKDIMNISSDQNAEMVYIDISSIDNVTKRIVTTRIIPIKGAPSRAKQLILPKDVILSTVRPNLNAVAIYETESYIPVVASTGFCVLRCKDELDYKYLFQFCLTDTVINILTEIAKGSSYPAVINSDVYNLKIPLPPLDEQRRIATEIECQFALAEKTITAIQSQLNTINALPAAILRQAFSGHM
ncbi:MAG: restriction endonuclease subunit S [Holophagales bacterium]|jgi:type I restriction enzyme S subunit|nr:restriction endonuclease subunit S [Holophagales bacterium]